MKNVLNQSLCHRQLGRESEGQLCSLWHAKHGVVERALVVLAFALLPKDEIEVAFQVRQHQALTILDAISIEDQCLHCIEALLIQHLLLVLVASHRVLRGLHVDLAR